MLHGTNVKQYVTRRPGVSAWTMSERATADRGGGGVAPVSGVCAARPPPVSRVGAHQRTTDHVARARHESDCAEGRPGLRRLSLLCSQTTEHTQTHCPWPRLDHRLQSLAATSTCPSVLGDISKLESAPSWRELAHELSDLKSQLQIDLPAAEPHLPTGEALDLLREEDGHWRGHADGGDGVVLEAREGVGHFLGDHPQRVLLLAHCIRTLHAAHLSNGTRARDHGNPWESCVACVAGRARLLVRLAV